MRIAALVLAVAAGACASAPAPVIARPNTPLPRAPEPVAKAARPLPSVGEAPPPRAPVASWDKEVARTKDGIDDDNPLPQRGPALDAFLRAVERARTDPKSAHRMFIDASQLTPGFYAAWFNAGVAAEAASDVSAAESAYRECLRLRPDYGPCLVNAHFVLARMGHPKEGDQVIDDALAKHPQKAGPHTAAAERALSRGDLARAESEARLAMRLDERNVPAMRVMALVFAAQRRWDTARFALENAVLVEPGNALLHLELGHVLVKLSEEKLALQQYEKAARLRPDLAEAQENYGVLLQKSGYLPEALAAFERTAALRPNSAPAQLHLGNGLRAAKRYVEAEAAYQKALALDPKLADAHFNLALLYIDNPLPGGDELQRWKQALAELEQFKAVGTLSPALEVRVAEYVDNTAKRIQREAKRRERELKRKADDAGAPADAAATAPVAKSGGGT